MKLDDKANPQALKDAPGATRFFRRRRVLLAGLALLATAQAPVPKPLPRVALETSAGRIVIELETVKAPITAGNFLRYVDQRRLDGYDSTAR